MKKTLAISVLFVIGLCLWFLPSTGEAVTVNCNRGQHVQNFVNNAQENSTIIVKGTCNENVVIDETRVNITLDGGGTATISGTTTYLNTIDVQGRGIVIKRLNITGGYNTIRLSKGGTATIDSNTIQFAYNNGVAITTGSYASIINNIIQNNAKQGVEVHDTATAHIGFMQYSDTVTQPNTIQNNQNHGINVQRSATATILGNFIENNANNGILVQRNSHADISGNLINGNGANGIRVQDGSGVNLGNATGTTIYDVPNSSSVNNVIWGISCNLLGYADGRLGTLNGANGATGFSATCLNNLQ